MTPDRLEIQFLLSTVNDVRVSPPMEMYQVADRVWQKCLEVSIMIPEMPWHEIKPSKGPNWLQLIRVQN